MATTSPSFLHIWRNDVVRSELLSHMDTDSICAMRLVANEVRVLTTPTLFRRTRITFTPSALTRPSRLQALSRIGHFIEHLIFSMPHTNATFLPPLLNSVTGREVNFLYTPHTSMASVTQRPKYGCTELGDLLTQQYPPIFHAATNVPAFINALAQLPNLRHLTISCPGQDPAQRYRRDAVDYALISLRIALERNNLHKLNKLSLNHMHPASLLYLRHMPGFGCTPSAGRRWKQIRKLSITMDSWDFQGPQSGRDHLKILDDYIRSFSSNLEKVSFGWNGRKGPCPLTLFSDPLFAPPRGRSKLFGEVTSPMSPLPAEPRRPQMSFPKLKYMQVRNAKMSTEQVASLVLEHRHTVKEFDFENVFLINEGLWEDALAPLARISGSDEWQSQLSGSDTEGSFYSRADPGQLDDINEVIETQTTLARVELEDSRPNVLIKKKTRHRRRRRKHRRKGEETEEPEKLIISAPIPIDRPIEEVLMPTTFDPNIQGVQRNILMEAAQQELADDPEKRVSALKKAREAVMRQLGREYSRSQSRTEQVRGFFKNSCAAKSGMMLGHESRSALVPLMFSRY